MASDWWSACQVLSNRFRERRRITRKTALPLRTWQSLHDWSTTIAVNYMLQAGPHSLWRGTAGANQGVEGRCLKLLIPCPSLSGQRRHLERASSVDWVAYEDAFVSDLLRRPGAGFCLLSTPRVDSWLGAQRL